MENFSFRKKEKDYKNPERMQNDYIEEIRKSKVEQKNYRDKIRKEWGIVVFLWNAE